MILKEENKKFKPEGLLQICKVVDSHLVTRNPVFYDCKLVFENKELAKKFRISFNEYLDQNKISSIKLIHDFKSNTTLKLDSIANTVFDNLFENTDFIGKHMLKIFKNLCDIDGIPELIIDAFGNQINLDELPKEFSAKLKN